MSSRPAIIRSGVDLPQPDGPTKTTMNSFLDVEVDAAQGVLVDSRVVILRTLLSTTSAMSSSALESFANRDDGGSQLPGHEPLTFHAACGQTAHQPALGEQEDDRDGEA